MLSARSQCLLVLAGVANYLVALFHLVIVFVGAPGYRYFGVQELAELQETGSVVPTVLTLGLTMMFALFATYALSGAGLFHRLPFLRTVLLAVGGVYILRGLAVGQNIVMLIAGDSKYPIAAAFSGAALLIGFAYVFGTIPLFRGLEARSEA